MAAFGVPCAVDVTPISTVLVLTEAQSNLLAIGVGVVVLFSTAAFVGYFGRRGPRV